MSKYQEKGPMKWLTGKIRLGSEIVDMIPMGFFEEAGAAGLAVLAAGIDATAAVLRGDLKGAGEEVACGAADAGVALIPFAEYARLIQGAGKVLGLEFTEHADFRSGARKLASHLYNKALGGRASSVFVDAASGGEEKPAQTTAGGHEIVADSPAVSPV